MLIPVHPKTARLEGPYEGGAALSYEERLSPNSPTRGADPRAQRRVGRWEALRGVSTAVTNQGQKTSEDVIHESSAGSGELEP